MTAKKNSPAKTGKKQDKKNRNPNGTFRKGVSGNPNGRSVGSRNSATIMAQKLLDDKSGEITQKAIELALQGDSSMIRICLERLVPQRKSFPVKVQLPAFESLLDLPQVTKAIAESTVAGILTPDEADNVLKIFDRHFKALELVDIEERLKKLEEKK